MSLQHMRLCQRCRERMDKNVNSCGTYFMTPQGGVIESSVCSMCGVITRTEIYACESVAMEAMRRAMAKQKETAYRATGTDGRAHYKEPFRDFD